MYMYNFCMGRLYPGILTTTMTKCAGKLLLWAAWQCPYYSRHATLYSLTALPRHSPAALVTSLPSEDSQNPHQVTVQEGQPQVLDCGSITSVPRADADWEIFDGLGTSAIDPAIEFAIAGLDGRLYLQNPIQVLNGIIFECRVLNRVTGTNKQGYIEVTVEGL